ncbi:hypothetical protein NDU88_010817 [Pleurodeles waltl]|uniref:Uncharacterized protein n=1 Tax=Pleurodeles waltl TaxID=8319 RepID=A0AAV7Q324_PLEWA|nr:hypothetical protein NDU88_010817 [Pleurodeles waltl]
MCWAADRRTERLGPCCGPGGLCGPRRIAQPERSLTAPPPLLSRGPRGKAGRGGSTESGPLGTEAAAGPSGLTTGPGVHGKAPVDPMRPSLRECLTENQRSGRGPAPVGAALSALTCAPGGPRRTQTGSINWGPARGNRGFLGALGHCRPLSVGTAQSQKRRGGCLVRGTGWALAAVCAWFQLVRLVWQAPLAGAGRGTETATGSERPRLTAAEPPALGAEHAWRSAWSPPCDAHERKSKLRRS